MPLQREAWAKARFEDMVNNVGWPPEMSRGDRIHSIVEIWDAYMASQRIKPARPSAADAEPVAVIAATLASGALATGREVHTVRTVEWARELLAEARLQCTRT